MNIDTPANRVSARPLTGSVRHTRMPDRTPAIPSSGAGTGAPAGDRRNGRRNAVEIAKDAALAASAMSAPATAMTRPPTAYPIITSACVSAP